MFSEYPPGGPLLPALPWSRARSVRFALQPAKMTSQGPPRPNPGMPLLAVGFPPLRLVALSAPRSPGGGRPARVTRHGPGRRRAGRFVQLRKEQLSGPAARAPKGWGWAGSGGTDGLPILYPRGHGRVPRGRASMPVSTSTRAENFCDRQVAAPGCLRIIAARGAPT